MTVRRTSFYLGVTATALLACCGVVACGDSNAAHMGSESSVDTAAPETRLRVRVESVRRARLAGAGRVTGTVRAFHRARITAEAQGIPNLKALGPVPYSDVNKYFARAKLFLNTSESEGFPNSFLQAWIRGVPIVSFFDPDDIISRQGLGVRVDSSGQMAVKLEELIGDKDRLQILAEHVRRFALDAYSADAVVTHYESLLGLEL